MNFIVNEISFRCGSGMSKDVELVSQSQGHRSVPGFSLQGDLE